MTDWIKNYNRGDPGSLIWWPGRIEASILDVGVLAEELF